MCIDMEHTWLQSGSNLSCEGLAISSVNPVIKEVRPIISENLAGGLSSSLNPHPINKVGTATDRYQMYRDCKNCFPPLAATAAALSPSTPWICWILCAACSRRAARKAARSSLLTCLRTAVANVWRNGCRGFDADIPGGVALTDLPATLVKSSRLAILILSNSLEVLMSEWKLWPPYHT